VRFAVVIRTYEWDAFIARQLARLRAVSDGGDLFVSVDQTQGPVGPIAHDRIFSTTNRDLLKLGLANRFERGSLVWWNNDYPTYAFRKCHPDYDYYVFVEYDCLVRRQLAPMIMQIAARKLDFVAQPMPAPLQDWFWWPLVRHVYRHDELHASLNCIAVFSARSLDLLFSRRLEMARDHSLKIWPISEAFVATEIARAGLTQAALSEFGDVGNYQSFPPFLEQDVLQPTERAFIHPVLDPPRYVASVLRHRDSWWDYVRRSSPLRQRLRRLPKKSRAMLIVRFVWIRIRALPRERWERSLQRARISMRRVP